jgi:hypothetical protein
MPKKKPKLDMDRIARGLGAERVGRVGDPLMGALRRGRVIMRELLKFRGAPLTAAKAARYLKVKTRDVRRMRDEHRLLSVGEDPLDLYPAWQFDRGGPLPGLCQVLRALAKNNNYAWDSFAFLAGRHEALGGESPLDRMKAGDWRAALRLAKTERNEQGAT